MQRQVAAQKILEAKDQKNLSWEEIAKAGDNSETWIVTALLGQATMEREEAEKIGKLLDLDEEVTQSLTQIPHRGNSMTMPPTDPTLYRLYEAVLVYGPTIKELIHDKFGDGIMSAIDFQLDVEKEKHAEGDRVKIIMNGKYLPYKKW